MAAALLEWQDSSQWFPAATRAGLSPRRRAPLGQGARLHPSLGHPGCSNNQEPPSQHPGNLQWHRHTQFVLWGQGWLACPSQGSSCSHPGQPGCYELQLWESVTWELCHICTPLTPTEITQMENIPLFLTTFSVMQPAGLWETCFGKQSSAELWTISCFTHFMLILLTSSQRIF